jgi:hypothetical protein
MIVSSCSRLLIGAALQRAPMLLTPLIVLVFLTPSPISAAISCPFCENGKLQDGSCTCLCKGNFLGPQCSFTALDQVVLDMYLNRSISTFQSSRFMPAVGTACPGANVTYLYARAITNFSCVLVRIEVSGFVVSRLLTSIAYRDPWVVEFDVVAGYPVTMMPVASSGLLDLVLVSTPSFSVTVSAAGWLAGVFALVFLAAFCESSCLSYDPPGIEAMRASQRLQPRLVAVSPRPAAPKENPLAAEFKKDLQRQQQQQPQQQQQAKQQPPPRQQHEPTTFRENSFARIVPQQSSTAARSSFVAQHAIQVKSKPK